MSAVTFSGLFIFAYSAGASHCCLILPLTISTTGVGAGVGVGVGGGSTKVELDGGKVLGSINFIDADGEGDAPGEACPAGTCVPLGAGAGWLAAGEGDPAAVVPGTTEGVAVA